MGLWQRLKRLFRASTGAALEKMEDPEMVLSNHPRMRDRVPELNMQSSGNGDRAFMAQNKGVAEQSLIWIQNQSVGQKWDVTRGDR